MIVKKRRNRKNCVHANLLTHTGRTISFHYIKCGLGVSMPYYCVGVLCGRYKEKS